MFRPDAGIIEAGRDAVRLGDLPVLVLEQVGAVAVQYAGLAAREGGGMLALQSFARRFDADHLDLRIVQAGVEQADGVRDAADRRDTHAAQAASQFYY